MATIKIGDLSLQVNRKNIKNLHISVLPPDGRVRVSAPEHMTTTAVRMAVISRIPWIRQQQVDFEKQERQSSREMVSGECHYLWGRPYRLEIAEQKGRHTVNVGPNNRLLLNINPDTSCNGRHKVLTEFYRCELKSRLEPLVDSWQAHIGVTASHLGIKKMKTKWGSCNTQSQRIWLNLELAKKPPVCLEYILVHELVHLIERRHNEKFKAYMDVFLPNWREARDLLNRSPLAHENWFY